MLAQKKKKKKGLAFGFGFGFGVVSWLFIWAGRSEDDCGGDTVEIMIEMSERVERRDEYVILWVVAVDVILWGSGRGVVAVDDTAVLIEYECERFFLNKRGREGGRM